MSDGLYINKNGDSRSRQKYNTLKLDRKVTRSNISLACQLYFMSFLGALAKLRKTTFSFVMCVRQYGTNPPQWVGFREV